MEIEILSQLNIGFFYNIFVSSLLAVISFIVGKKVQPLFNIVNDRSTFYHKYLGLFWVSSGFAWFIESFRLFFAWRGDVILDKVLFFSYIVVVAAQVFFLFLFCLSILFRRFNFSPFLGFLSGIVSAIFLFFAFIEGVTPGIASVWHTGWALSSVSITLFTYIIFIPLILILILIGIRELFYIVFNKVELFDKRHLFSSIALGFYLLVLFPEVQGLLIGWWAIVFHAFLIIAAFIIYLVYTGGQGRIDDLEPVSFFKKLLGQRPLLLKTITLVIISSIIPLIAAGILIYYSFKIVFGPVEITLREIILKNFQGQIIIIALVIGIMTFFMGIIWARLLVSRIRSLHKGTHEISSGNFGFYIEQKGAKDEINLLAHLFNMMSDYLGGYQEKVDEYSSTLEEQVRDRTQELEDKTIEADALAQEHEGLLKQLQTRSDIILENMGDGLVILNSELNIIKTNSIFLKQFNVKSKTILNKSFSKIDKLQEYQVLGETITKLHKKGLPMLDVRIELSRPLIGEMECRFSPIELEDGKIGTMILFHEVSLPWGVVYNANTMAPIKLAMVRLIDEATDKVIDTEVTDPNGRFGFFVSPGSYYVSVIKDGFHFPATKPEGYHGEVLTIKNRDEGAIKFNILMDPIINTDESGIVDLQVGTKATKVNKNISKKMVSDLLTVEELESKNSK